MTDAAARRGRGATSLAVVGLLALAGAGGLFWDRASRMETARTQSATNLAAFQRCLAGEPLAPGETLGGRLRGVELALALDEATRADRLELDGGAGLDGGDAGAADDAGAAPLSLESAWPARCAPFAEALRRSLDATGDGRLDALREALPSRVRFSLPYALMADEAAELAAAVDKAGLPGPARPADNEPAPPSLVAPLSTAGVTPLGAGRLRLTHSTGETARQYGTDVLATSTIHLLLRDARARACALAPDGPAGPYGVARCGNLPEWLLAFDWGTMRFPVLDDGAPLAVYARKARPSGAPGRDSIQGILVFTPAGTKAIPINGANITNDAFMAADGSYLIPGYAPLVRLGKVDPRGSDDIGAGTANHTLSGLNAGVRYAFAAYGMVFADDQPNYSHPFDPRRRFRGRRMTPVYETEATDLGPPSTSESPFDRLALGGCHVGDRIALLFDVAEGARVPGRKARLVLAEGPAPLHRLDPELGTTPPHLYCGKEGVVVTSVEPAPRPGSVVVVESRCSATACETKRSDPVAVPAGVDVDAATLEGGVVLTWVTREDQATSAARGMAFYRFGALEGLASASPRPLFEGARRGGVDVRHVQLVPRPRAAIVALETGGKAPVTYAVRIDAAGAAAAVRMEETKW